MRLNVQVFVFTVNPHFEVLILKRTPERSGYWQPVSGGIEKGEEPESAVIREVTEETGIRTVKRVINLDYAFSYKEPKNGVLMDMQDFCFAVEIDALQGVQLSDEHEQYKWCSYEEARQWLKWEHNLVALDKLKEIVGTA